MFGHLAIGQQPTALHNQYFVLKWDFSMVDPQGDADQIRGALHRYVNRRVQDFALTYRHILPIEIPIEPEDALISFLALLAAVRETPYRLYLMVDDALRAHPAVQEAFAAAEGQLAAYRQTLRAKYGDALDLRTYTVVAVGFDRLVWEEVKA